MSTSHETFLIFLDALVASMDDPDVDGARLAAGMHISRFHLDRILTATAGESPTRLRRRILLERAAYRLATTHLGLLDIAVEAGYSSNEAFTRAFRRSFAATPSAWRRAPGQIHLPAGNGVHFHPPGGLRVPARTKATSMDLVITMVEHHVHLVREMIHRSASLGDEQLDAAIELSVQSIDADPTIRTLLSRLVGQLHMWNCSVASRPYDLSIEHRESLESMSERLSEHGAIFSAQVRAVVEARGIEETFVDATVQPPEVFTYGAMIAHVLTYAAYRRTLVTEALASAGVDLDDDPLHWEPLEA